MPIFNETVSVSFAVIPALKDGKVFPTERRQVGPLIISVTNLGQFAPGPGASASDNFNRANNNSLGSDWVEVEDGASDLRIASNELICDDQGQVDRAFAYWNTSFPSNQEASIEYRSHVSAVNEPESGPAVRIDTASTITSFTGYVALCDPAGQRVRLLKYISQSLSGSGTTLATVTSITFTAGDVFKISAQGVTIKVLRNGATIIEVSDSGIASGRPGIVLRQGYTL